MAETKEHPFIAYLESLASEQNRGKLAALRRGLGQPAGTVADMYPYVVPWLPVKVSHQEEAAYYLIASLFAFHPESTPEGNLGSHLARTIADEQGRQAVERRFMALLNAHPDDLDVALRQVISFLRSKDQPINWRQLLRDICNWNHPERFVQKNWANSFWSRRTAEESPAQASA